MNFLKKLFSISNSEENPSSNDELFSQPVELSLDDLFVHNFIEKGGKFLYCTSLEEADNHLKEILNDNQWKTIAVKNLTFKHHCKKLGIPTTDNCIDFPFLTGCEHLIADKGNIMLSSHQLSDTRLNDLNINFIVFAKTSQLVKNMNEGLTGIKNNFFGKIPSNICTINGYNILEEETFLNYGNSNLKNLYLILLEDL